MMWRGVAQRQIDLAALTIAERAQTMADEAREALRLHNDDCVRYRETLRQELAEQRRDTTEHFVRQENTQARMHGENTARFDRADTQAITRFEKLDARAKRLEAVYYFGMAVMTVIGFSASALGQRVLALLLAR